MSRLLPLAVDNPTAAVLTLLAGAATVAAAATVAGSATTRAVLRVVALAVVLWLFAAGFWAVTLGERMD